MTEMTLRGPFPWMPPWLHQPAQEAAVLPQVPGSNPSPATALFPKLELDAAPIGAVQAAANISAPLTAGAGAGSTQVVTVQSAPVAVVLSSAPVEESGRCVGLTSSSTLRPAVVVDATGLPDQQSTQVTPGTGESMAARAAAAAPPAAAATPAAATAAEAQLPLPQPRPDRVLAAAG